MLTDHYTRELRRKEMNEACQCACPDGIAPSKISMYSDTGADVLILLSARSQPLLSRHLSGRYVSVGSRSRFARPHIGSQPKSGQGSNYDEKTSPRVNCPSVTAKSTSWESVRWTGSQLRACGPH